MKNSGVQMVQQVSCISVFIVNTVKHAFKKSLIRKILSDLAYLGNYLYFIRLITLMFRDVEKLLNRL